MFWLDPDPQDPYPVRPEFEKDIQQFLMKKLSLFVKKNLGLDPDPDWIRIQRGSLRI